MRLQFNKKQIKIIISEIKKYKKPPNRIQKSFHFERLRDRHVNVPLRTKKCARAGCMPCQMKLPTWIYILLLAY